MKNFIYLSLLIVFVFAATGCAGNSQSQSPETLKIAVLPILDSLPLQVALAEGYFEKHNLQVELISVSSAPERDQLMQSGQVDGILNETLSTILYNKDGQKAVVVRFLRIATPEYPLFRILSSKDSGITTPDQLKGVPIAISEGTVIEYVTERVLVKAGLDLSDIEIIGVPKIPDRMALLDSGEIQAAVLPDPLSSLSMQKGAVMVIDDTSYPEISNSVLTLSAQTIKDNPQAVKNLLAALEDAVNAINSDKTHWNNLLTELNLVPPPVLGEYTIPDFPTASVPTQEQFEDALQWTKDKGIVTTDISYQDTVNGSFLP